LAYLYIIVIVSYLFKLNIEIINVVSAVFFLANISYFQKTEFTWNLAHYWSLSTEEQFYLLLPVFIKKKFSVFVAILLFTCLVVPLIVYLQSVIPLLNIEILSSALRYLIKIQGISIGCLFSVLLFKGYLNFGKLSLMVTLISIFMIFYLNIAFITTPLLPT
jgi:peptidoglycan/LPS O-acetylase OafA/YrhL